MAVGLGCEVLSSLEVYHLIKTPTLCSVHSDAGGFVPGFVCNNPNVVLKLWTLHISLSLSLSLSLFMQSVFSSSEFFSQVPLEKASCV